jgi:hypothetical protein
MGNAWIQGRAFISQPPTCCKRVQHLSSTLQPAVCASSQKAALFFVAKTCLHDTMAQSPSRIGRQREHHSRMCDLMYERDELTDEYVSRFKEESSLQLKYYSINSLDRQIKGLQRKKEELESMRAEAELERDLRISLLERDSYDITSRSVRQLCSRMLHDLPRELRDMIYEYLYFSVDYEEHRGYPQREELDATSKFAVAKQKEEPVISSSYLGGTKLDDYRMGHECFREYHETYFRLHTFRTLVTKCVDLVNYLNTTHLDYGFKPANCTRSLEIWAYTTYKYRENDKITPVLLEDMIDTSREDDNFCRAFNRALDSLKHLKYVRIILDGIRYPPHTFTQWGLDLLPWLRKFSKRFWQEEERGCRVDILFYSKFYKREFRAHSATDYDGYVEQLCAWGTVGTALARLKRFANTFRSSRRTTAHGNPSDDGWHAVNRSYHNSTTVTLGK